MGQTVQKLTISHFKGVRHVSIVGSPTVNEVAGPNGSGKTSTLKGIVACLGGKREIGAKPLRAGAEEGEIVCETDKIVGRRTFSERGDSKVVFTAKGGGKLLQGDVDALLGPFTWDPLAISRKSAGELAGILQGLAGAEFAARLAAQENAISDAEAAARAARSELKRVGSIPPVNEAHPVDIAALDSELQALEGRNAQSMRLRQSRAAVEAEIKANQEMIAAYRRQIEELEHQIGLRAANGLRLAANLTEISTPEPLVDIGPARAAVGAANAQNVLAANYAAYEKRIADQAERGRELNAAEDRVKQLRGEREALQRGAVLPIDGVEFGSAGIRVRGIPWEELAASERIRAAVRIGVAYVDDLERRKGDALRMLFIFDGALLDDESYRELEQLAEEHRVQIWIETAGSWSCACGWRGRHVSECPKCAGAVVAPGHGDAVVLELGEVIERGSL